MNETKILVIGDREAGKSSVVESLVTGKAVLDKGTRPIGEISNEIDTVTMAVNSNSNLYKLNLWDFGGQQYEYSTFKFFLTTRSLYLLVVDARKGDQIGNIEYWLKLIAGFSGDSPIIIAINQIDQLIGQRALSLDREDLRRNYNVKDFVETSCTSQIGIEKLKTTIVREVEQLEHVHEPWPPEWLTIKQRLEELQADYIPIEKYLEICAEEKVTNESVCLSLLGRLNDLGIVSQFLGATQVLNPHWVTQGVYGLLASANLGKAQGQLDLKDVGRILTGLPDAKGRYPTHTHRRLIDVMRQFELCFEFTDRPEHYLIPYHLHDNELDIPWDANDGLKFEYHYETLPDTIISRFIVRMYQYITSQYYWKNGVFLQSGDSRAKIKADLVDRKVLISINGKDRTSRAFLAVIRSAFEEINRNLETEIKQMIPVPGSAKALVSYRDLLTLEEMNEPEIVVPELRKKFRVRELLDGVEELSSRIERGEADLNERRYADVMPEEIQLKPRLPPSPSKGNPLRSMMSFVLGFIILLAVIVGAAVVISKWVSVTSVVMTGVIIIGALLAIGVVGAMVLRYDDRISEPNFLKLMIESYKRLPLLRGKR